MKHTEIIQNILLLIIAIILITVSYSYTMNKNVWDRFTFQNWQELLKYIDWDKTADINFLR